MTINLGLTRRWAGRAGAVERAAAKLAERGRPKVSAAQRKVLQTIAEGGDLGESWVQNGDRDRLAWHRHERTIDALTRKGLIRTTELGDSELTDAGREALIRSNTSEGK